MRAARYLRVLPQEVESVPLFWVEAALMADGIEEERDWKRRAQLAKAIAGGR